MESRTFTKNNSEFSIEINQEEYYFKIIKAEIKDFQALKSYHFPIRITLPDNKPLESILVDTTKLQDDGISTINRVLIPSNSSIRVQKVIVSVEKEKIGEEELTLFYETRNLNVSMNHPWSAFQKHLEEDDNTKILFSAPFGQGKTTFLKEFFRIDNENTGNYEVFHLFPVNYAVANNEDIFRLIKTEILVKLLENPAIEFKKESFTYLQTLPYFALKNAHKILSPFLKALPVVGESVFGIYEKLESLTQNYFSEHDKLQNDERKTAVQYIQEAYEDEGSIFEDNFYSQLIRQLIQQLKDQGKQTVLIIDDTDRMDPEHIFRILNVFAAHFDAPEYRNGDSNKFGFDKIIIVCDYDNLHKIFRHKYGPTTDFAGYIDKFFSKQIYRYDNAIAVRELIYSIIPEEKKQLFSNFNFILSDLVRLNIISLREVLKIKRNNPVLGFEYLYRELLHKNISSSTLSTIHLLDKLFGTKILSEKISHCRDIVTEFESLHSKQWEYNKFSLDLIKDILLVENYNAIDTTKKFNFEFRKKIFEIEMRTNYRDYMVDSVFLDGAKYEKLFSANEFYELVLIFIGKYEKVITEK